MALRVLQQPERARLCSFKEENDTIDRRPVDPPPVVQLLKGPNDPYDLFEFTAYFIRASIVHPYPSHTAKDVTADDYLPVKTPTGADSTAGEVVQTPELLKGLDGQYASMVIFAKLSVRVPGVFRLKFTLYQNTSRGVDEITSIVSDPFEVFSPKLFKGMRESTPLTRHLASQGLKVKLRTDTTVGRHSDARKKTARTNRVASATATETARTASPMPRSSVEAHVLPAPVPVHPIKIPGPSRPVSSYTAHPPLPPPHSGYRSAPPPPPGPSRSLIWRPSFNHIYSESSIIQRPSGTPPNRYSDDGSISSLRDISSRFDHTPDFPSADLSAFSLSADSKRSDSSASSSRPYSTRTSSTSSSASRTYSPYSVPSSTTSLPSSLPSQSSKSGSSGDDGMPVLPSFLLSGPSSGPLLPPPHPSLASVLSQPAFSSHSAPLARDTSTDGNLKMDPRM